MTQSPHPVETVSELDWTRILELFNTGIDHYMDVILPNDLAKPLLAHILSRRSLDTADGVEERVTAALQTALVAMSLASALPGVSAEYDFSAAISAIEEVL